MSGKSQIGDRHTEVGPGLHRQAGLATSRAHLLRHERPPVALLRLPDRDQPVGAENGNECRSRGLTGVRQDEAPKKQAGGALTPEGLSAMLSGLAYAPKDVGKNKDVYQIVVDRDDWKIFIQVSLSTDRKYVWLDAATKVLADPDKATPAAWLKLLALNDEIIPARFAFDKKHKQIHLLSPFDNRGVTPARLRTREKRVTSRLALSWHLSSASDRKDGPWPNQTIRSKSASASWRRRRRRKRS